MGKANKVTDLVLMIYNITEYDGVKVFHLKGDGFMNYMMSLREGWAHYDEWNVGEIIHIKSARMVELSPILRILYYCRIKKNKDYERI